MMNPASQAVLRSNGSGLVRERGGRGLCIMAGASGI